MSVMDAIPESWRTALEPALAASAGLETFLADEERSGKTIYPPRDAWLRAFELTPLEAVSVVILGQDPYHGAGQAHGLAFSVPNGIKKPPSLVNIHKELASDLGCAVPSHGNLEHWARQGVLLLNNALTVEDGRAGSHQGKGWEALTDATVAAVATAPRPSVFMLWGKPAQTKVGRVGGLAAGRHLVLAAPHPSPLAAYRGFLGCRHFSQANRFLEACGRTPIDWALP
jgi:uracil-DNA glycosylase